MKPRTAPKNIKSKTNSELKIKKERIKIPPENPARPAKIQARLTSEKRPGLFAVQSLVHHPVGFAVFLARHVREGNFPEIHFQIPNLDEKREQPFLLYFILTVQLAHHKFRIGPDFHRHFFNLLASIKRFDFFES